MQYDDDADDDVLMTSQCGRLILKMSGPMPMALALAPVALASEVLALRDEALALRFWP